MFILLGSGRTRRCMRAKWNLFAQGKAEIAEDVEMIKAALAHPGDVLRLARRTTAEHLAAAENKK